jgi:hypothetical protein
VKELRPFLCTYCCFLVHHGRMSFKCRATSMCLGGWQVVHSVAIDLLVGRVNTFHFGRKTLFEGGIILFILHGSPAGSSGIKIRHYPVETPSTFRLDSSGRTTSPIVGGLGTIQLISMERTSVVSIHCNYKVRRYFCPRVSSIYFMSEFGSICQLTLGVIINS